MRFQVQLPDAADLPQDYPPYLPNMQVLNSDCVSFIQFAESPPLSWMSCLWQKLYSSPSPRPTENSDKAVPSWTELVPSVDSGNLRTPKLTFPVNGRGWEWLCAHLSPLDTYKKMQRNETLLAIKETERQSPSHTDCLHPESVLLKNVPPQCHRISRIPPSPELP